MQQQKNEEIIHVGVGSLKLTVFIYQTALV